MAVAEALGAPAPWTQGDTAQEPAWGSYRPAPATG
jgi:hypothetical protein